MWFFKQIIHGRFSIIFLLTFVNGLSMTMLFPVLPFFIREYDQGEVVLGVLLATFSFFQFIAAPILWAISDKYGRKPVLLITQTGTFLSWIVLSLAYFTPEIKVLGYFLLPVVVVFISRVFDGITWWNNSVAQAVIADLSEPEERAKVFWMNGAVFWVTLIVWPALWSLAMSSSYSYLWVGILGGFISLLTLWIMCFMFSESLQESDKQKELKISFKDLNILSQVKKWSKIETIRYVMIMKSIMFIAFVSYTSVSALYLIDNFWFKAENVGYYLTFTWTFLIFHQSVSIRYFLKHFKDRKTLLISFAIMGAWFIAMWLSQNIFIFTIMYFITILWISLWFTTIGSLFSRGAEPKNQGEVMWVAAWIESFMSIWVPIVATMVYWLYANQMYVVIWIFPFIGLLVSYIYFRDIEFNR